MKVNFRLNYLVLFSILTMSIFFGCVAAIAASNTIAGETDLSVQSETYWGTESQSLWSENPSVMSSDSENYRPELKGQHFLAQKQGAETKSSAPSSKNSTGLSSASEAARKSSNPLGGDFFILLNQFDNYAMQGDITDKQRWLNTWSFQPVVPIPMKKTLGDHWIWVNRPTFPFVLNADLPDADDLNPGLTPDGPPSGTRPPGDIPAGGVPFDSFSGFGDIVYFTLLGQSLPQQRWGGGDFVWAGGLTTKFPTASKDELGGGVYSIGPSAVLSFIGKKFILGALYQQWLSYAEGGNGSGDNENFSWLNLFYFLNLENGWQVGGTPIITADWEADKSEDRWTVPIGLGVYKTQIFGKMPIKFGLEAQWMPINPDNYGQNWDIRITFAPIIPSLFK